MTNSIEGLGAVEDEEEEGETSKRKYGITDDEDEDNQWHKRRLQ